MNGSLLLLKRLVILNQNLDVDFNCPICISNHRCAKSPRFDTIEKLLNHLRGKHPDEPTRKAIQNLAKNLKMALELGMIKK